MQTLWQGLQKVAQENPGTRKYIVPLLRKYGFKKRAPEYDAVLELHDQIPSRTAQHLRIIGKPDSRFAHLKMEHPSGHVLTLYPENGLFRYYVDGKGKGLLRFSPQKIAQWLDQVFRHWPDNL